MAASTRVIAVSTWPSSQRGHDIKARSGHPGILASRTSRQSLLLAACVECLDGPFDRFAGTGKTSHEKANHGLSAHRVEQFRSSAARFGELKQGGDHFLGQWQLTANDARSGQPEHDLELLGGVSE